MVALPPWTWTIPYSKTLPMKDGNKNWNLLTTNKWEKYYCFRSTISTKKRVSVGLLGFFGYMLTYVDKLLIFRVHLEEGDQHSPQDQTEVPRNRNLVLALLRDDGCQPFRTTEVKDRRHQPRQHPHEQRRGNQIDQFFFFALREKQLLKSGWKQRKQGLFRYQYRYLAPEELKEDALFTGDYPEDVDPCLA